MTVSRLLAPGLAVLVLGLASGCAQGGGPTAREVWRLAGAGLATPESVLWDPESDVYLVSNIVGSPSAEDGEAFIARVSPEGRVIELKWIDSHRDGIELDAPKGMALVGQTLWVADIHNLRRFDRGSGESRGSIPIEGSAFLNDLCPDGEGGVYVSDSGTHRVHRVSANGAVTLVVDDERLAQPNGLLLTAEGLLVLSFGGREVFRITDGGLQPWARLPAAGLDGVVSIDDGTLIISSWKGRALYHLDTEAHSRILVDGLVAPADIGWDGSRRRLLVPLFKDDAVAVWELADPR